MAIESKIEWTDGTANPWWGCAKVSPACTNCYAETWATRWSQAWGPGTERTQKKAWRGDARRLNRKAVKEGRRMRMFALSMGDWLDHEVPAAWLLELFEVIAETPNVDWLLLTKRPERFRERIEAAAEPFVEHGVDTPGGLLAYDWACGIAPKNVWLGITVENHQWLEKRADDYFAIPAHVRFLSVEPLLGYVDLGVLPTLVDWVIVGGESGPGARPMHPLWALQLRDQVREAGVAFFFKQWGAWGPGPDHGEPVLNDKGYVIDSVTIDDGRGNFARMLRRGKKETGRQLAGFVWNQFPKNTPRPDGAEV